MLAVVYASSQLDRQIMAVVLEPIKLELGASDTQMGFLIGMTFAVFYATLGMPIAMIADRHNRRNIIAIAITIWSFFTVLCGFASTFLQLALARIGVGIGEAGSTPPSHSLIADLFPAASRATAMGIFAVGANVGLLLAYLVGGWLVEHYGWRLTFFAVGIPGVLIAVVVYVTTIEPSRGMSDALQTREPSATEPAPPFWGVARYLWSSHTCRNIIAGASCAAFIGYGLALWLPTFFIRSHGLSLSEIGIILAVMSGLIGGAGTFTAGRIADYLSLRDERWRCWMVSLASVAMVPFLTAFFLAESTTLALVLYAIPAFLNGAFVAPTYSMMQGLVGLRMRALASAILLFAMNIIGMGLGPQVVGILSDLLAESFDDQSLRFALLALSLLNLVCAWYYFAASRSLKAELSGY